MNVKIRPSGVRNRAVGMLQAGITQVNVATEFGKSIRTIKRWWLKQKRGESLEHRQGAGRPKSLSRASKSQSPNLWGNDASQYDLWPGESQHPVILSLKTQSTGI